MKITNEKIKKIAEISHISLDENSLLTLKNSIDTALELLEPLSELQADIPPEIVNISQLENIFRDDVVIESFNKDEILVNSPNCSKTGFIVPKIIE